jgi:hypothetical protein
MKIPSDHNGIKTYHVLVVADDNSDHSYNKGTSHQETDIFLKGK